MIYFFHHYELPAVLQQARIQQFLAHTQQQQQQQQQNQQQSQNQEQNQPAGQEQSNPSNGSNVADRPASSESPPATNQAPLVAPEASSAEPTSGDGSAPPPQVPPSASNLQLVSEEDTDVVPASSSSINDVYSSGRRNIGISSSMEPTDGVKLDGAEGGLRDSSEPELNGGCGENRLVRDQQQQLRRRMKDTKIDSDVSEVQSSSPTDDSSRESTHSVPKSMENQLSS